MLDAPQGWVGPDHFTVRRNDTSAASSALAAAAEYDIAAFWGPVFKVRSMVDKRANAWALRNRRRSDIKPLVDAGFVSVPL